MNIKETLAAHAIWLSGNGGKRADLSDANLSDANLVGADLRGARQIPALAAATLTIVPAGEIVGWKACRNGVIVRLVIPADSPRSNATGRKCRAAWANVSEVIGAEVGISKHDADFVYRRGETVRAEDFDPDRWNECAPGIHFFLTPEEAKAYTLA